MIRQASAFSLMLYLLAGAGLLALAIFFGVRPGHDLEPLQAPARTALVNAQQHLSMSFSHERELVDQASAAHRELSETLNLLAQAKRAEPAMQAQIDTLRARLAKLGDDARLESMAPGALNQAYRELSDRIEALIRDS